MSDVKWRQVRTPPHGDVIWINAAHVVAVEVYVDAAHVSRRRVYLSSGVSFIVLDTPENMAALLGEDYD